MLNKIIIAIITGILFSSAAVWCADLSPEASLKNNFPRIKVERLHPSPIKGIYEVVTDTGLSLIHI